MLALLVLAVVGLALFAAIVGAALLRTVLWLLFLPFRLLFALLLLPFLLIKAIVSALLFLVAGPVVAVLAIVASLVLAAVLAVPLTPVLLVLFAVWLLRRPRRQSSGDERTHQDAGTHRVPASCAIRGSGLGTRGSGLGVGARGTGARDSGLGDSGFGSRVQPACREPAEPSNPPNRTRRTPRTLEPSNLRTGTPIRLNRDSRPPARIGVTPAVSTRSSGSQANIA